MTGLPSSRESQLRVMCKEPEFHIHLIPGLHFAPIDAIVGAVCAQPCPLTAAPLRPQHSGPPPTTQAPALSPALGWGAAPQTHSGPAGQPIPSAHSAPAPELISILLSGH